MAGSAVLARGIFVSLERSIKDFRILFLFPTDSSLNCLVFDVASPFLGRMAAAEAPVHLKYLPYDISQI